MLIVTHGHLDHSAGADAFAEVHIHQDELAEAHDAAGTPLTAQAVADQLHLDGTVGENLPPLLFDDDWTDKRVICCGRGPGQNAHTVADGDWFTIGDVRYEIVGLPGHTPGSIGVWCPEQRYLFTGDALYEGRLLDELPTSNKSDYVSTMERICALGPRYVFPGHGPVLDGKTAMAISETYIRMHHRPAARLRDS